jgi:hypothetical protein
MTSSHPRPISISLNEERGKGGQTKLAHLLGWHYTDVWRTLTRRSLFTQSVELAMQQALEKLPYKSRATPMPTQKCCGAKA